MSIAASRNRADLGSTLYVYPAWHDRFLANVLGEVIRTSGARNAVLKAFDTDGRRSTVLALRTAVPPSQSTSKSTKPRRTSATFKIEHDETAVGVLVLTGLSKPISHRNQDRIVAFGQSMAAYLSTRAIDQPRPKPCAAPKFDELAADLHGASTLALEASQRFEELFQGLPVACCSYNEQGKIVDWNRAFVELVGRSESALFECTLDDLTGGYNPVRDDFRFTKAEVFAGASLSGIEARIVRPDGTIRYVLQNVIPFRCAKDGVSGVISTFTDVTALREMRANIDAQQTLLRTVIDSDPNLIYVLDKGGRFILANRAIAQFLGTTVEALMGANVFSAVPNSDLARTMFLANIQVFETGREQIVEEREVVDSTGRVRVMQEYRCPLTRPTAADIDLVFCICMDISDRKRSERDQRRAREAADAANRAKSNFLANMSHELRTPLNAIIGFSEMIIDQVAGPITPKQEKYVGNILSSGQHLLHLVNDILDLSKIEAGRMEMQLSTFDPLEALRNVEALVKPLAEKKDIRLEFKTEITSISIFADEAKFKQVLYNLLSNAIKFTRDSGRVRTLARVIQSELTISVVDTGIGLHQEDLERIFGEFEQVDSSFARKQQGTGLGLALTRKLVEMHGGRIWAESRGENLGTKFTFTLPVDTFDDYGGAY
jgi:PAS domain S-box-containing protein